MARVEKLIDRLFAMEDRRNAGATLQEIAAEFGGSTEGVRKSLQRVERWRRGEQLRMQQPTNLEALELTGQIPCRLRSALESAGITDLMQLQGRPRREVLVLPGVATTSLATIAAIMKAHGLAPMDSGNRWA